MSPSRANLPIAPQQAREALLRTAAGIAAAAGLALGLVALLGWWLGAGALGGPRAPWLAMGPDAALGFLLAGLALGWLRIGQTRGLACRAGQACAGAVALLGLAGLAEGASGWDPGLEGFLLHAFPGASGLVLPVRWPPTVALCFLLSGLALLLLDRDAWRGHPPAQILILPPLAISLVALLGTLYGVAGDAPRHSSFGVASAAGFFVLGSGVLCARPQRGWMALVASDTAGGALVRRLLPALLLVLPLLGWLASAGARASLYDAASGIGLTILASLPILTALLWRQARCLERVDLRRQEREASRREGEARLRMAHERFVAALQTSPVAVFTQDRSLRYTWIHNPAFGLSAAQVVGATDQDLLERAEDARRVSAIKRRVLETGVSVREEVSVRVEGRLRRYDLTVQPQRTEDGIVGVLCIAMDITERQEAADRLGESEERLRLFIEHAPAALAMFDRNMRYVHVSRRWCSDYGLDGQDLCGRSHYEVFPEIPERWRELHRRGLAGEVLRSDEDRFERAAGRTQWLRWEIRPWHDSAGQVAGIVVFSEDITDRKLAEEALREAARRKDEFLATLAHELRNPLAPIRNAVEILRVLSVPDPTLRAARDMIDRQVSHMVRLIDDLLDVSRITRGRLELKRERVALESVVEQAVDASRPHIESARHRLALSLPPSPVYLDADPVRLAQVFSNLLNNAAKYTEPGGKISFVAQLEGAQIVATVADTGIGIAPEHLPGVFEMFSQAGSALDRSQGGLGIGLALARSLVELHGGRIEAKSEGLGRGSAFAVRLPVLAEAPALEVAQTARRGALPAKPRRILVVDDNRDSARSLAVLLRLAGNEVETAFDGLEAVEAAERYRPDVILLDIGMPKLDGYAACRSIRERPWADNVAIVALTGWGQADDRSKSRRAGFDGHLVKPVEAQALLRVLDEAACARSAS